MEHARELRSKIEDGEALVVGALADDQFTKIDYTACNIVELRLDSLGYDTSVMAFAENCPLPLLVTARGPAEGGQRDWTIAERSEAYRTLLPFATLIDVELRDFDLLDEVITEAKQQSVMVIGSFHDFATTPELDFLAGKFDTRADIHKFALMSQSPADIHTQLDLVGTFEGSAVSVMGMGPLGAAARPLMAAAGSCLNYGYLGGQATAPHQWPAQLLAETLRL